MTYTTDICCVSLRRLDVRMMMSVGLVSPLLDLQRSSLSLGPHMAFPLHAHTPHVSFCLTRETSPIGLGPPVRASLSLNYWFAGPISKYSHFLRCWGLGLYSVNLRKNIVQSMITYKQTPTLDVPVGGGPFPNLTLKESQGVWVPWILFVV